MDNRRWTDEISLIIFLYTLKTYIYGEGLLVSMQSVSEEQTIQLIADLIISYNLTMFVDRDLWRHDPWEPNLSKNINIYYILNIIYLSARA